METGALYFWTATINNWQKLLLHDAYKDVLVASLQHLSSLNNIDVFAFVLMPNPIHVIGRIKESKGKETPQGSFLKYTAHEFKKRWKSKNPQALNTYAVSASNKSFEFWQSDSLAIRLYPKEVAMQKLRYIHNHPMAEHGNVVKNPCDYQYSSAR